MNAHNAGFRETTMPKNSKVINTTEAIMKYLKAPQSKRKQYEEHIAIMVREKTC